MKHFNCVKTVLLLALLALPIGMGWSADGLVVKIEKVTINTDLKAEVTFSMTDETGEPLGITGVTEGGDVSSPRFILSYLEGTDYHCYITRTQTVPEGYPNAGVSADQATTDSGGTFADLGGGRYTYTFKTAVPADYKGGLTHTVSGQISRPVGDNTYYANPVHHFIPNGGQVTQLLRVSTTETCNKCHTSMGFHGGSRKEITYCQTCHTAENLDPDTGNSVELGTMIHKIHMGEHLPSVQAGVPYEIVGHNQTLVDFSEIAFPQAPNDCTVCHTGEEGSIYKTAPSMKGCGSCHDDIDFANGVGHIKQTDNSMCALCHTPEGSGLSIVDAHVVPAKSPKLKGLIAEIVSVSNTAPGQNPTIVYKLHEADGTPVAPSSLSSNNVNFAGPTKEYTSYIREDSKGAVQQGDAWSYTFTNPIPANAVGTYAFAIEGRRTVTLTTISGEVSVTEGLMNPIALAKVTDAQPVARREIIDQSKCNGCHGSLGLHGGQRTNVEFCVFCHNPKESDIAVRPDGVGGGVPINFSYMIHKIHRGSELTQDYTVYGYRSSVHNYNHIEFPGIENSCTICHTSNPTLPLPSEVAAIDFTDKDGKQVHIPPTTAICTSCHDTQEVADHAAMYNAGGQETCFACHGPGGFKDIALTHKLDVFLNAEVTFGGQGTRVSDWLMQ
ncbi:MAG: OmcA/MtrC family decaheme c-type cytochrome [bacterium]|nr:OmcA/MtrC family decaheme c-type cytochrome [bacterium]